MRLTSFLLLATASAATLGKSHRRHQHRHEIKRADVTVVETEIVTAYAYEYNGNLISSSEVCDGIKDGRFLWQDGNNDGLSCLPLTVPTSSANAATSATMIPSSSSNIVGTNQITSTASEAKSASKAMSKATSSSSVAVTSQVTQVPSYVTTSGQTSYVLPLSQKPSSSPASSKASSLPTSSATYSNPSTSAQAQGLGKKFPSGTIDCSIFPSDYGAVPVPWLNVGGWSGVQLPPLGTANMATAVSGMGCTKGGACSYACPIGWQKSQWPDELQGGLGQSVGGLLCNENNKLELTNPKLSEYLCIQGTGATFVHNQLQQNAAICRTDYPGTESETVPMNTLPGQTYNLTCPDSKDYYKHKGASTTAEYYINNQGVNVEEACSWGKDGTNRGNWAPTYIGVGADLYGKTWLSIASTEQNDPTNHQPLNYTITLTGEGLSGKCRLKNDKYCSGDNYGTCNSGPYAGCTVELLSGTATYVFSDD